MYVRTTVLERVLRFVWKCMCVSVRETERERERESERERKWTSRVEGKKVLSGQKNESRKGK